jgi:hypothetical protein
VDLTNPLIRAFSALTEMWSRRYDTPDEDIPDPTEGEPFGSPVVVDFGLLAQAQTSLAEVIQSQEPDLWKSLQEGGVPDAPLPEDSSRVISLDQHRIRSDAEFQDEQVAYMEVIWGRETFAYNLAIRDLELMRRGGEDKTLRPPQTYHELQHLVLHIRALANDLAREYGMEELIREDDDLERPKGEGPHDPS